MKKIAFGFASMVLALATSLCFAQKVADMRRIELPNHVIQVTSLSSETDDPDFASDGKIDSASSIILVSQEQYDAKRHTLFEKNLKLTRLLYFGTKTTLVASMVVIASADGNQSGPSDVNAFKTAIVKRQNAAMESMKRRPLKESEYFLPDKVRDLTINGRYWAYYVTNATIPLEIFDTPLDEGHFLRLSFVLLGNKVEFHDRSREIINEVMNSITITPKSK